MKIRAACALVILVACASHRSFADDHDPAGAEVLFKEGRSAATSGNFELACAKFGESYRLDPAPGTLLNLGDCEENLGQFARAWQHFRQLYDQLPAADDRRVLARSRANAVEPRVPKLAISISPSSGATVLRDNIKLAPPSFGVPLPVDPGHHVVVVSAAGHADKRYDISLAESENRDVAVSLGPALKEPPKPAEAMVPVVEPKGEGKHGEKVLLAAPAQNAPPSTTQRTIGFTMGGVGVATLAAGTILGITAMSHLANANAGCTGNACVSGAAVNQYERAQSFALATDITLAVGAALTCAAVVLVLTAPRSLHSPSSALSTWLLNPTGAVW